MKSEEDLDNIFKKSLNDPANHRAYNEDDWDAFEQMLDAGKKRRGIVYWLPIASGIAAMLLLALGWWLFIKPAKVIDNNNTQAGVKPTVTKPATNSAAVQQVQKDTTTNKQQPVNNMAVNKVHKDTIWNTQPNNNNLAASKNKGKQQVQPQTSLTPSAVGYRRDVTGNDNLANNKRDTAILKDGARMAGVDPFNGSVANVLANSGLSLDIKVAALSAADFKPQIDRPVAEPVNNTGKPTKKVTKQGFGYRPQWAITALASSDVNGTNAFQGKTGSNYGALLSVGVSRKLTITSGVVYSSKPYNTSFANYKTSFNFKNPPSDVLADCKMLDIPINIGYQVFGNFRNKVSVGTGFSSYIMLHEKYTYTYAATNNSAYPGNNSAAWPQSYTVPNSKGYYLSIVNINATYERKINSKFGISVQPYMKVPISGVGYSDLKLQSTGVAVGVTYNINAFRKP